VRGGTLTREALARIDDWSAREQVECLYFLADSADPETAPLAEAAGFRLVDVRVTLERRMAAAGPGVGTPAAAVSGVAVPTGAAPAGTALAAREHGEQETDADAQPSTPGGPEAAAGARVRPAAPGDVPELRRIAAASHHDSRFYHDPHFDRGRCDELYATWIEKSCADPAGAVLVAELAAVGTVGDPAPTAAPGSCTAPSSVTAAALVPALTAVPGPPCGYVTLTLAPAGEGRIGLFAVAEAAQGRGIGGLLIAAALAWFVAHGAGTVSVVTQGRNVRAQRIYQKFGMLTRSLELWYHRWWRRGAAAAAGSWPGEERSGP
jgi:dTDP-4-amino-4,6-dideoxy-D-galactose acyltransferase